MGWGSCEIVGVISSRVTSLHLFGRFSDLPFNRRLFCFNIDDVRRTLYSVCGMHIAYVQRR